MSPSSIQINAIIVMQPADMPLTPLARADVLLSAQSAPQAVKSSMAVTAAPRTPAPPESWTAMQKGGADYRSINETRLDSAWLIDASTHGCAAAHAPLARYEHRDPTTGRVWGMPSAFGRGQCLDCPRKAAPPSERCEACQRARIETCEPMPPQDLELLQGAFGALLKSLGRGDHASDRLREEVSGRLQQLYDKLQKGQVGRILQVNLLAVAQAANKGDRSTASKAVASIVKEHWGQHRGWLLGLKALFSKS